MSAPKGRPPTAPSIHAALERRGLQALIDEARGNRRTIARIQAASTALAEDFRAHHTIAWTHSAFCMVGLPHSRPAFDEMPWHRHNGRLHLLVEPGSIIEHDQPRFVGVPYGPKARLILLYLQTHARTDGVVPLGPSLSAWLKQLGLGVTGGPKGTITAIREQVLRLARARISIHFTDAGGTTSAVADRTPVDGLRLWADGDPCLREWHGELHLTPAFVAALLAHPVPVAHHAISYLKGSALALDLYLWLVYRLYTLRRSESGRLILWTHIAGQCGADFRRADQLGHHIRASMAEVLAVYPGARVEVEPAGVRLLTSPSAVPGARRRP